MTERERQFAAIGWEYAEGIDNAKVVIVPDTGREIRKLPSGKWECQPWNDNYWKEFDDLLKAAKFASRPKVVAHDYDLMHSDRNERIGSVHMTEAEYQEYVSGSPPEGHILLSSLDADQVELSEELDGDTRVFIANL